METIIDIKTLKNYHSYKDSGVEWIEDVPSHWEVKKFKRVFYEIKKRSNPELSCGSISFGKVVYKDDEKIPESTKRSYQVVKRGDFLLNPLNLNYDLISLRIALSDIDVVVSSGYIVLNNSVKLDKTYYKYFLHRFDVAFMKLLGSGVRQTLNWNDIANCDLVFPPLPEQTSIAAFLDRKITLIDQAIDIKQKQIELLKERRQILIHKAVTRGLNPNVKMKDSSVEWIGEIPVGWELLTLKRMVSTGIIEFQDGNHGGEYPRENEFSDIGIPFIKPRDMQNGEILFESSDKLSLERSLKLRIGFAKKNDTLIVNRGGSIGKICFVNDDYGNQDFFIINPQVTYLRAIKDLDSKYLYNLCESNVIQIAVDMILGYGSTFSFLGLGNMGKFPIPIPPIKEQKEISKWIENASQKLSTAISLKEQEIAKLKEYKSTLINSAVTGKIKVC